MIRLAERYGVTAPSAEPGEHAALLVRAGIAGGAEDFLDALAERVAIGVSSVVAVLDPGCVVLGGEVGRAGGEELAGRVAERLAGMSPLPTRVRVGELGGGAVLRGALLTARDAVQESVFAARLG